ncbi:helix-turn-helix transcriptional regulator [Pseudoalteromonas phage HS6]|uniref:helix-turn-helix transcriptional regulator n=1 Tax=Pseudoalteromonas phage HS6 TaxID=1357710 RepID=UPI0023294CD1|nr:helix-turn-helix transcriptional regulator [Pseudoalteromonas phage HS6]
MAAFNQYLKALRERKFLDVGSVALHTGVHRNTQSKYEDSRDPPFDYLVEFSELVGVPLVEILLKRLDDSKASECAVNSAKSCLNHDKQSIQEVQQNYAPANKLKSVELVEESHKLIPPGSTAFVNTAEKVIDAGNMYAFLNPMTGEHFAAKLSLTSTKLKLVFDNSKRKDLVFAVEGGETESHYILKTLGLLGRIVKVELNF